MLAACTASLPPTCLPFTKTFGTVVCRRRRVVAADGGGGGRWGAGGTHNSNVRETIVYQVVDTSNATFHSSKWVCTPCVTHDCWGGGGGGGCSTKSTTALHRNSWNIDMILIRIALQSIRYIVIPRGLWWVWWRSVVLS